LPLLRFVVAINLVSIAFVVVVYGAVARLARHRRSSPRQVRNQHDITRKCCYRWRPDTE